MANLLCFIELVSGRALPVSLEVLGQGRRVASQLGATLYAVVALPRAPTWSEDDLVAQLAAHGADKVVIATDEALGTAEELRWGTHGTPLAAVCDLLSPSLLLFGMTPTGREVAARAAARMGAAYLVDAWIEADDGRLRLFEGAGAAARALDDDLEFAVVATVPAGRYARATGDDEAEVEVVATSGRPADFEELEAEARAEAGPRALVVTDARTRAAAARLAAALGGAVVEGVVAEAVVRQEKVAASVAVAAPATARAKPKSGRSPRSSSSSKVAAKAKATKGAAAPKGAGAKDGASKGAAARDAAAGAAATAGAVATSDGDAAAATRDGASSGAAATGARLVITLGPPCPAAERRVRLGSGNADADYVLDGDAALLAAELARALGRGDR